jgi:hypothetical protein
MLELDLHLMNFDPKWWNQTSIQWNSPLNVGTYKSIQVAIMRFGNSKIPS